MGIKKITPTSPARRYQTCLPRDELTVGATPEKSLLAPKTGITGRNNNGRITVRRRGGPVECRATVGQVGNVEHEDVSLGKAGRMRWKGIRPHVRGVAMNPVDHPHGGGEGKTSGGRNPVTPWGKPTRGYKTRHNKRTKKMIVRDRRVK